MNANDTRYTIAHAVAKFLDDTMTTREGRSVRTVISETTSGCPIVTVICADGQIFNLTVTKSRTP